MWACVCVFVLVVSLNRITMKWDAFLLNTMQLQKCVQCPFTHCVHYSHIVAYIAWWHYPNVTYEKVIQLYSKCPYIFSFLECLTLMIQYETNTENGFSHKWHHWTMSHIWKYPFDRYHIQIFPVTLTCWMENKAHIT